MYNLLPSSVMHDFHSLKTILLLLLGDTDSGTISTGGLGVLSSDLETPEVSKTSVASRLQTNTVGNC